MKKHKSKAIRYLQYLYFAYLKEHVEDLKVMDRYEVLATLLVGCLVVCSVVVVIGLLAITIQILGWWILTLPLWIIPIGVIYLIGIWTRERMD
jgi:hypothetical protein